MWSESPRGKTASSLTAELWTAGCSFFRMLKLLFVLKILFKNVFTFLLHFLIGAPFPFSFLSSIKIIQIHISSHLLTRFGNYLNKLTLLLLSGCFFILELLFSCLSFIVFRLFIVKFNLNFLPLTLVQSLWWSVLQKKGSFMGKIHYHIYIYMYVLYNDNWLLPKQLSI